MAHVKRLLTVLLLLAISCWSTLAQGQQSARVEAAKWVTVAPADAGFSVLMPSQPAEKADPLKGSNVQYRTFSLETSLGAGYVVSIAQFPDDITNEEDVNKLLDSGREGGLASTGGKLKSEKEIKLNQYLGREWLVDLPGGFSATSRAYWIKRRLYQIVFVVEPKASDDAALLAVRQDAANKFFNSFSVKADAGQ